MEWPTIDDISAMALLPDGYRYEMLARSGIPALIDRIRLWHPDVGVGGASCHLQEDFSNSEVALADKHGA